MAKLVLTDFASLTSNEASAIATLNANNAAIETAMEITLSRDGTSPNMMSADLDMNSNQIINLPAATTSTEPVRLAEFEDGMADLEATVTTIRNQTEVFKNEAQTAAVEAEQFRDEAEVFRDECEIFAQTLGGELNATREFIEDTVNDLVDSTTSIIATYTDVAEDPGSLTLERAALTGDISAAQNSNSTTLATVNANVGTFGSATQTAQVTVNAKGLTTAASNVTVTPAVGSITGLAAGVSTFLATPSSANLRSAVTDESGTGALLFASGAIGTPTSGTLTNCTGLPISTGVSGLAANVATFLGTPSSANLASALTDETGTGANVFANTPTLVTPVLGTPTSGTLTNCTGLPISTGVSGLGANVATFLATPSSANLASAVTDETGSGALVFGTSPSLTTPVLPSYIDFTEIAAPANPGANIARMYSKDDAGTTKLYFRDSAGTETNITGGGAGSGDVTGPASSTDNGIPRFDGTGGKTLQTSVLTIADTTGDIAHTSSDGVGIQGTDTNDNAAAGQYGEYVSSTIASGSAVTLTDATTATITSVSLTAGDWDVEGQFYMLIAGGETITDARAAVHDVAATVPSFGNGLSGLTFLSQTFNSNGSFPTGCRRFSLASTTTIYLNAYVDWSGGSGVSGFGTLRARRVR